ncbi:SMODS domain-containing nucleotidyltransferase [Vacuolonema iberomarrocanum]|uniref:SMODS domain-containing nucleotidyltransferase n=1 Tax=Vacuolonema iberomarrocanum TaxID=3454632 RepID=UPI001A094F71|nr:nucleotidyltransferase [filamentous cyanobacterium LEGE 07170]
MSVNSHLTNLASTLILSEEEKSSITTSINTLSLRLTLYFSTTVTSHFQFGSSTRGTILPRKADSHSDIDYMVVFNTSDGQRKPQTYLDRLRRFVEARYSTSEICQSHPTIVLSLNHINFELVPAIYNYGYQIPSPASYWLEWTSTDPSGNNKLLQDKNKDNSYQIKSLVRLIKYWNVRKGYPFTAFSLEQHIVNQSFWGCSTLKDYFYEFWSGFNCTYATAQYIKNMVENAKNHVRKAKEYEYTNMPVNAELEIKKIVPSL